MNAVISNDEITKKKIEKNNNDVECCQGIIGVFTLAVILYIVYAMYAGFCAAINSLNVISSYTEFKVVSLDVVPNSITLALNLNLTLLLMTRYPILFKPFSVSLEYHNKTLPVSRFDELFYPTKESITMLPLEMHVTASQMKSDNFYSISSDLGVKQFLEFDVIIQSKYWLVERSNNDFYDENFKCKLVVDKLPDEDSYTLGSRVIACNSTNSTSNT